jgi:hyperosmotically inducible protein
MKRRRELRAVSAAPFTTEAVQGKSSMKKQAFRFILAASLFAIVGHSASAQTSSRSAASPTSAVSPDNSKTNALDQTNRTATADAQKDNKNDRLLTQRIRQSVIADKSLSTYGHNVKIVSVNGTVTLNGVVRSDEERSTIEAKAVSVAGKEHVVNDLKVTPTN